MYGQRDEPAGVLAELGGRLQAVLLPADVAAVTVETIARSLRVPNVVLDIVDDGGGLHVVAEHGAQRRSRTSCSGLSSACRTRPASAGRPPARGIWAGRMGPWATTTVVAVTAPSGARILSVDLSAPTGPSSAILTQVRTVLPAGPLDQTTIARVVSAPNQSGSSATLGVGVLGAVGAQTARTTGQDGDPWRFRSRAADIGARCRRLRLPRSRGGRRSGLRNGGQPGAEPLQSRCQAVRTGPSTRTDQGALHMGRGSPPLCGDTIATLSSPGGQGNPSCPARPQYPFAECAPGVPQHALPRDVSPDGSYGTARRTTRA